MSSCAIVPEVDPSALEIKPSHLDYKNKVEGPEFTSSHRHMEYVLHIEQLLLKNWA